MKPLFPALRSVVYMTGFVLLFTWIALRVRVFDRYFGSPIAVAVQIPGAIVAVLGLTLVLACGGVFILQGHGTPAIFDARRTFVAFGPYRYVQTSYTSAG